MTEIVLDAHALMAYFEGEPGFEVVSSLFTDAAARQCRLLMTSVNVGEIYYVVLRARGEDALSQVNQALTTLPIEVIDADLALAEAAARLKARHHMSYADCFAAGLAQLREGDVVTGDPEFRAVEADVTVRWLC
jgi:ribonuclease VapC